MSRKEELTQPLSGFRDMLAEQMLPREKMVSGITRVYERYGFTPLDTPTIERQEVLMGKYGDEGEKLIYKFRDHGRRKVALRYDLTVPLARVVADNYPHNINLPYKRYQRGKVFRGERPQAGRYREFEQLDADVVGSESAMTDAEIVAMMADTMEELGVNAVVRVNNRRILDALAEKCGINDDSRFRSLLGSIDKYEKVGERKVVQEVQYKFNPDTAKVVKDYLNIRGEDDEKRHSVLHKFLGDSEAANEGVENLRNVSGMLRNAGYKKDKVVFDTTIARGLDYYTGIVYETILVDNPNIGSVCSGGRYDNLIQDLGGPDLPAVGTSVGVDRLYTALEQAGKFEGEKSPTKLLITSFEEADSPEYFKLATFLRKAGIATEVYPDSDLSIGKQIRYADNQGIPNVAFLGSREIQSGKVAVKNLKTGKQEDIPIKELVKRLNG